MAEQEIYGIKVTTDAKEATAAMGELDQSTKKTDESVKSLRAQLKEATANVAIMADKFGAGSKQAVEAAKKAADLRDRIGDAKLMTDAFNPDAKFKAVAASLAGVAGGFSALQGLMALFGTENKKVEQALLKVNAAMALTQGLNAIGDSIDAFKILNIKIQESTTFQNANNAATKTAAAVQKAFGISVDTTTTGFKLLKGAIVATGITALVVVLGEVIGNFDKISNWIKNSPLGDLASGVGKLVEKFTDFVGITSEAERNLEAVRKATARGNEDIAARIKVLEAQGGKEKEIHDLKLQQTEAELGVLREALKTKGSLTDEEQKKFRDLKTQQAVINAEYQKKVSDDDEKARAEAQKKTDEHNKKIADANKKNQEEIAKDTDTANKMLLDLQNEKVLAEITSEEEKAKKKLEIDADAKKKEIDSLKISEEEKTKLKKAVDESLNAELAAIDKKAKDEREKNDKEFEKNLSKTLNESRLAAMKDGKSKELEQLKIDLEEQTTEIKDNAQLTEEQKGKLIAAERDKYLSKVQEIQDKYDKEANDKEQDRLKEIVKNEESSYKAKKEAIDDLIALNNKLYKEGKISAEEYTKKDKEYSDSRQEVAKKEAAVRSENMKKVASTLQNVAKAIGEHTVAGKAAAVAAATIETYQAAVSAFKSMAGIPVVGPVLGAAAAAAAIVAGIKNVKTILAVKAPDIPKGSSEPGFIDIPPPPSAPATPSMPSAGDITMPDLGGGAPDVGSDTGTGGGGTGGGNPARGGGGNMQPVKVYVLESDISDTQERVRVIQENARFE